MKRTFLKFVPLCIGVVMALSSCGSSDDGEGEKPKDETIPVVETPAVPTASQVFPIGVNESVMYKGAFTDNEDLKQVVFTLTSLKQTKGVEDNPWATQTETVVLSGKSDEVDQAIFGEIPGDIYNGEEGYKLSIVCEDVAGNKSATKEITILLK